MRKINQFLWDYGVLGWSVIVGQRLFCAAFGHVGAESTTELKRHDGGDFCRTFPQYVCKKPHTRVLQCARCFTMTDKYFEREEGEE